ncbi:hypothetical protein DEA8626_00343 [Defluviimonas aquaemixtae]|uniref:Uncharacterized protein n=1 Tax=Albidovulum aquaemixtae TaxID=1542388 RepID=A0A2R8B2G8_9RHOB|nr:hypothetical protein DEA8626_00343 [Defluviimonas aquaemixtae]
MHRQAPNPPVQQPRPGDRQPRPPRVVWKFTDWAAI